MRFLWHLYDCRQYWVWPCADLIAETSDHLGTRLAISFLERFLRGWRTLPTADCSQVYHRLKLLRIRAKDILLYLAKTWRVGLWLSDGFLDDLLVIILWRFLRMDGSSLCDVWCIVQKVVSQRGRDRFLEANHVFLMVWWLSWNLTLTYSFEFRNHYDYFPSIRFSVVR